MADLRICGASSRFGVPVSRLGLVMALPEVEALVGLVGKAAALEILLEVSLAVSGSALSLKNKSRLKKIVEGPRVWPVNLEARGDRSGS